MEHLWAPWRTTYISTQANKGGNPFTEIFRSTDDAANWVLCRSKACFAVLNSFPYNTGHSLVLPNREIADPSELSDDETLDLWRTVWRVKSALQKAFAPAGFNIGANLGACAGAGIPSHLHIHLVPRWEHDSNFMTTTAHTRVHPNDLDGVYRRVYEALNPADAPSIPLA